MPCAAHIPAWFPSSSPLQSPSEEWCWCWVLLSRLIPLTYKMCAIFFIFLYQFEKLFSREAGFRRRRSSAQTLTLWYPHSSYFGGILEEFLFIYFFREVLLILTAAQLTRQDS